VLTPEERQTRDEAICDFYVRGASVAECGRKFGLKRQRVTQILKRAKVWRPYIMQGRTKFLGVSIKEETHAKLQERAQAQGKSVSKLTSDALDALVEK
jgi:predicted HicB family RNase H-like nuclease